MISLNRFLAYIFSLEVILTTSFLFLTNKTIRWLQGILITNQSDGSDYMFYYSIIRIAAITYDVLMILILWLIFNSMYKRANWLEKGLYQQNKAQVFKIIVVLVIGHSLIYLMSDIAFTIDFLNGNTNYPLLVHLIDLNLYSGNIFFISTTNYTRDIVFQSITTNIIGTIENSFIVGFFHYLILVLIDYSGNYANRGNELLYPQSKE